MLLQQGERSGADIRGKGGCWREFGGIRSRGGAGFFFGDFAFFGWSGCAFFGWSGCAFFGLGYFIFFL